MRDGKRGGRRNSRHFPPKNWLFIIRDTVALVLAGTSTVRVCVAVHMFALASALERRQMRKEKFDAPGMKRARSLPQNSVRVSIKRHEDANKLNRMKLALKQPDRVEATETR